MPVAGSVGTHKSKGHGRHVCKAMCVSPALSFPSDLSLTLSFQLFSHTPLAEHMPGMNGGHEATSENRNGPEEKQAFMEDSIPLFPTLSF